MRLWIASLALAACSTAVPEVPRPVPVAKPVAPPPPAAPAPVAPPPLWPELNLGFEQATGEQPSGWGNTSSYEWAVVSDPRHGGERSLRLRSSGSSPFGTAGTGTSAEPVRGKHLILRGWIKTEAVKGSAALWLRIDGGGGALDNMTNRGITGTTDWTQVAAEVDVPEGGERVAFGPLLFGEGTAWFDDLRFEVTERKQQHPIVLEGTVVDTAGKPVAEAEVALVGRTAIQAHVRSGADGRFHFDTVTGTWGFSAHHPAAAGAFVDTKRFDDDTRSIVVTLGASDGVTVRGKLGPGTPAPGAYVTVSMASEHDADAFAVPVAPDGTFTAILPRGDDYTAQVVEGGMGVGSAKRVGDRVDIAIQMPVLAPPPQDVVDWIGGRAIPLATTEAGHGLDDIAPIGKLVGDARVVALGEATHGTREFFQLKHRVLEYLVARHGFTVFAIEANQPECRAINDYVLHGTGDPKAGLDGIYFWTWNTEEVLAMIEWMRAWNADPKHRNKVQFLGFDMQTARVAHANVAAFLTKVAPDAAPGMLAPIEVLGGPQARPAVAGLTADQRKHLTDGLAAIAKALDAGRKTWARTSSAVELDDIRHDVTILEQATELYAPGTQTSFNVRDRSMATNIQWILAHQPPRTRMVVWAHNGHIANHLRGGSGLVNMGSHLRRQLKAAYLSLGFVFSQGSFQAVEQGVRSGLNEITLGDPPEYNASVAFARTGKPLLVLDLRSLPTRGPVRDWFASPHPVRDTGAVFTSEQNMTVSMILPELYDGIIFVDRTTRARPLHPRR